MSNFAEKLKFLRKQRNLTQSQLSSLTNIPIGTIKRLESSVDSIPNQDRLVLLSKCFNVSIDYLISDSEIEDELYNNEIIFIREILKKYKVDLTDNNNKQILEIMMKLVFE